jgi:hypothetical protein
MEETTMRRIIGRIAATLVVAAALGVGCVLTAKPIPLVGAIERSDTGEKADVISASLLPSQSPLKVMMRSARL